MGKSLEELAGDDHHDADEELVVIEDLGDLRKPDDNTNRV